MAMPYKAMEAIFGWSKSAIEEWCQKIRKIICKHMAHFRQVLTSFGQDWQHEKMVVFRLEMLRRQNLHLFTERCQIQNAYEQIVSFIIVAYVLFFDLFVHIVLVFVKI